MAKKGDKLARLVNIPIIATKIKDISAEAVTIAAGAAGTVKTFQLNYSPVLDSGKEYIGGFGDTSLSFATGVFDVEVESQTADADLANGEYWIDYLTGHGRGKKKTTGTSEAVSYSVREEASQLADPMAYMGVIDASSNPNYPSADAGYVYVISVAGKIGGASGEVVEAGDMIICNTDGSAGGTEASVGTEWDTIQTNIDGAVTGPSSAVDDRVATFDGVTGKIIQDGGKTIAEIMAGFGNTITVATSGGDYTTISDALSACSAGDTILVYPDTYTETLTIPANNITLIAMGKPNTVIVTQADASVVDFNTRTGIQIKGFKLQVTAATTAIATVTGSTGSCILKECQTDMTTTANIATPAQPCVGEVTGAGTLKLALGKFTYVNSGDGGGTAQKGAFKVANGGLVKMDLIREGVITTSGTELATSLCIDLASTGSVQINDCTLTITGSGSLIAGLAYLGGTGILHEFYRNQIEINATGATNAYGLYAGDTATVTRTFFNHLHIENATNNYSFYIGASATVISHFDDIVAVDGHTGGGTFSEVSSENDGDLNISGDLGVTGSIGATGSRVTKGWFTDLEVTNAIAGSVTGNAGTVTNATLTTALTVDTGTVTLSGNVANSSVLTIGAGAVSVSGSNTGDQVAGDFNHDDLASITGTVGQYNHPTDANMTVLNNTSGTNTGDNTVCTSGTATTAETLATARTIAGVSFDGSANISLNNNAITNGAGYTTNTGDTVLASVQSVTGLKTYDKEKIAMKGTSTGTNLISVANTSATSYTNIIPAKDGTFAMTSDISGGTLDEAYNGGNTIDVDDSAVIMTTSLNDNNEVLNLVQNDTTNNPVALDITNAGSGYALEIDQNGNGQAIHITSDSTSQAMIYGSCGTATMALGEPNDTFAGCYFFKRDGVSADTGQPVMAVYQDNVGDDQQTIHIRQDGTGEGVFVDQNGDATGIEIDSEATTAGNVALKITTGAGASDMDINGLLMIKDSVSTADDGTITLPTGVSGILEVWEDTEHMRVHVGTDGAVTSIYGTANTAVTDSDTDLCVYDGGTGGVIKNRLGGTKTLRYIYNYS